MPRFRMAVVLGSIVVSFGAVPEAFGQAAVSQPVHPRQALLPGAEGIHFVDEASCRSCHSSEAEAWQGSHHDWAMDVASAETVLGDFGDATFADRGVTTRFFRRDGGFFVHTEGPDGEMGDFRVAYTFGVEPLQQYLVAFPGGRLQTLTIAWDTDAKRWFTLYPEERIPATDALHWTGRYQTWNFMCAECHSTDLRKRYDAAQDRYETTWARIDVGCQACHGPGVRHVGWARAREGKDDGAGVSVVPSAGGSGLVVQLGQLSAPELVDTCARCHARRHRVSPEDAHGRPFLDDFAPELLRDGLYEADGQIREEVYVYGSFLQSRMYAMGVACTDCHDPHALGVKLSGDALCLQCHASTPPERFPSLRGAKYDTPEHHLHPQSSEGARCVGCHMPARTYMQVDPRRDHGFRIPRPDLTQKLGVPNACTGCHEDRSAGWATGVLDERKGKGWRRGSGHAAAFHDGREAAPGGERALLSLAEDPAVAAIVRATALEQLRIYGPAAGGVVTEAAMSDEALVRAAAAGGIDLVSPEARARLAARLLRDPVRAVRAEAARALASTGAELGPEDRKALAVAMAELEAAERTNADGTGGRTNLAVFAAAQGNAAEAEQHYLAALRLDPAFFPASLNLASQYNGEGRNDEAEQVLRAAAARSPGEGELHYSLGLLLAEQKRLAEAEKSLAAAAERIPDRGRVRYNHALALQHLGRRAEAEQELLEALRLEPDDPAVSHALVILYLQDQRFEEALPHAERLAVLVPEAGGLLQRIRFELSQQQ